MTFARLVYMWRRFQMSQLSLKIYLTIENKSPQKSRWNTAMQELIFATLKSWNTIYICEAAYAIYTADNEKFSQLRLECSVPE